MSHTDLRSEPGATDEAAPSPRARPGRPAREVDVRVSVRLMGFVAAMLLVGTTWVSTQTLRGQVWNERGRMSLGSSAKAWARVVDPLALISVVSVAICLVVYVAFALLRGRFGLACAVVLMLAGANITTQLLKHTLVPHPLLASNSLPSGHSTVGMSVALGAVLVAPSGARRWLVPFAGFVATFVGAGTVVGHWHRPGDVIAAFFVCLLWSAISIGLVLRVQHRRRTRDARYAMRPALGLLGSVLVGLVFISVGVRPIDHDVTLVAAVISLSGIGVVAAFVVAWVSAAADDNLG